MKAERLFGGPIITPQTDATIGDNINGPTLIRTPEWLPGRLGKYYLYFAHHIGKHIRLAYSDSLEGPWKVYEPGVLSLTELPYLDQGERGHIASPEIYIDETGRRLIMYYHGKLVLPRPEGNKDVDYDQKTYIAVSEDGLHFIPMNEIIGGPYLRVFPYKGYFYTLEMSGQVMRSVNGLTDFEKGPVLFKDWDMRHCTLLLKGDTLYVFHSIRGTSPESLVCSTVDVSGDWLDWHESPYELLLKPEKDYEGGNAPEERSTFGAVFGLHRQLRDPYIYEEDGRYYLLYSVAGENGIAVAEVFF